jgi:hypothetical protein
MIYIEQKPQQMQGLGSWFSRTVANVHKFYQQTDLFNHALTELGVGKTTVGKILAPGTINVDKYQTIVKKDIPKPVLKVVDAVNCAKPEFAKDSRCVEFMKAQAVAQTSQQVIAVQEETVSNKSAWIVGGALSAAVVLVLLARKKKPKALAGAPKSKRKVQSKK